MKPNISEKIRKLAEMGQYGHSRTPRNFYMTAGGGSFYWDNHRAFTTQSEWDKACCILARYHRFCEVVEGWKDVPGTIAYYADNSSAITQVSRQGKTRQFTLCAPGGDACF